MGLTGLTFDKVSTVKLLGMYYRLAITEARQMDARGRINRTTMKYEKAIIKELAERMGFDADDLVKEISD